MLEFIILVLLYWALPVIVILKNSLWDLYLWESKGYRMRRFWEYIRWDRDELRSALLTNIKFIIFAILTVLLANPIPSMVFAFIAYGIWFFEVQKFLKAILFKEFLTPSINLRNLSIFAFLATVLSLIIVVITTPFLLFREAGVKTDFLQNLGTEPRVYFDVFLFIVLSSIFGLFLDFITPLLLATGVLITKPFSFLEQKYLHFKIYNKLKASSKIILILGSEFLELSASFIQKNIDTRVENPAQVIAHWRDLFRILPQITKKSEYLVFKLSTADKLEIQTLLSIVQPDVMLVLPNFKLFTKGGDYSQIVMPNHTKVVCSAKQLILFKAKEEQVTYSLEKTNANFNGKVNIAAPLNLPVLTISSTSNREQFKILHEEPQAPALALSLISLLKVIGKQSSKNISFDFKLDIDSFVTPNGVTIYRFWKEPNYIVIRKIFTQFVQKKFGERLVLFTDGIRGFGSGKYKVIQNIKKYLKEVDTVITSDYSLYHLLIKDNIDKECIFISDLSEIEYIMSRNVKKGDIVIAEGKFSSLVI